MSIVNLVHEDITDEESYENVKESHKLYPDVSMNPTEWKRQRLVNLKKEGRSWSK